jgi:hypothetical protein
MFINNNKKKDLFVYYLGLENAMYFPHKSKEGVTIYRGIKRFIYEQKTEDKIIGILDDRGFVLRISQHCKQDRDIDIYNDSKKRTIDHMHIERAHYIIRLLA